MNAWTIILDIVLILISIVLIIAVLLQQGQRQGLGAIAGGAETFFGKNKAKGYEAKMAKITKIGAAVFIVAAIAATIVAAHSTPDDAADVVDDTAYTAEELEHDHDGDGIPDHTADEHTDTAVEATQVPSAEATEAPTDAAADEPAAEATEAPADDAANEPAAETTEAPEAVTEAPAAEATEEPAAEATEEPAEETEPVAE